MGAMCGVKKHTSHTETDAKNKETTKTAPFFCSLAVTLQKAHPQKRKAYFTFFLEIPKN
jgi:hypothetical protein